MNIGFSDITGFGLEEGGHGSPKIRQKNFIILERETERDTKTDRKKLKNGQKY